MPVLFRRKDERKALVVKGVSPEVHLQIKALAAYWSMPMYKLVQRLIEIGLETERVKRALRHMKRRQPL